MARVTVFMVDGVPSKVCPMCEFPLPLTAYAQDNSKSDARTSHCKECRNLMKRLRREKGHKFKKYNQEPHKVKAKAKVRQALKVGMLKKSNHCEVCDAQTKLEGHHKDYSKPYEVIWVCKDCHAFIHSQAFKRLGGGRNNGRRNQRK